MNDMVTDLCGEWLFAFARVAPETPFRTLDELAASGVELRPAAVPGNFELDLLAAGLIEDPFFGLNALKLRELEDCHVWYGRRFSYRPPAEPVEVELRLEGVDCYARVYLNGRHIG